MQERSYFLRDSLNHYDDWLNKRILAVNPTVTYGCYSNWWGGSGSQVPCLWYGSPIFMPSGTLLKN